MVGYPKFVANPIETVSFMIHFDTDLRTTTTAKGSIDFNCQFELKALSRRSRDLIQIAYKCFTATTHIKTA